ncbi:MAG: hypothetical protein WCH34_08720 [Bacteroidota bacterium]
MKKFYRFGLLFSGLIFLMLSSCEIYNPSEDQPSYIHIDSVGLTTDYITQGTASHKITDVWVYVDNELVGAFELPANIPVLKSGTHKVTIRPGIKLNGIAATRSYYPFFNAFDTNNVQLEVGKQFVVYPTFRYGTYTKFSWKEDFESAGVSLERTTTSDTIIELTNDPNLMFHLANETNTYSAAIYLDQSHSIFEFRTINSYPLPIGGSPVFLELNYKTNNYFAIGVTGNTTGQQISTTVIYLSPNEKWNKIYINLTPTVSNMISAIDYKIFIRGVLDSGDSNGLILLDNIKLVHQ